MDIVDTLMGFGPTFYWILGGSLLVGMLILAYVWREFSGWFFRTHEILKELRALRTEVAVIKELLAKSTETPATGKPIAYSATTQSLDLVTGPGSMNTTASVFPEEHRGPSNFQSNQKPQFTLRS